MAGAGYKLFNTGDVLTAAQVNTYLQEQTVMVFANAAARTTALSGVLAEGMMSYLQDTNAVEVYNGSSWVNVGNAGDITEVQAGTGISVASGTGPIPVVTNSMATTIDAKGDLIVGTGSDTFARLAVGTNGYVLTAASGETTGLKWTPNGTFIGCFIQDGDNQSVANTTYTSAVFDGADLIDTDAFHNPSSNNTRITIPTGLGGKYLFFAQLTFASDTSGNQQIARFAKNGTLVASASSLRGTSPATQMTSLWMADLVATDYMEIQGYQSSGGNLNLQDRSFGCIYLGA